MRPKNNIAIMYTLLVSALAFIPVAVFIRRQHLFELSDAVIIASIAGILVGYAEDTWEAIRLPPHKLEAAQVMIVGLSIGGFGLMVVFGGMWAWRAQRPPEATEYIIDSLWFAFSRWMVATGFLLIVASTRPKDGMVPARSYHRAAAMATAGLIGAALLIIFGFS
jgi:hypothetical protein